MKKFFAVLLSLFLVLSYAGCSNKSGLSPDDPVTLNLWHVYGSQTKSPLNDAIYEFNSTIGKEKGIIINIASVTSSSAIDNALKASANGEPGADELPDLFTAYPRVAQIVGKDRLLDWSEYFSADELGEFSADFISEGYFDERLLMLPIAKSSEVLYVNKTLFDKFSKETGAQYSSLSSFEGIFETAKLYYDATGSDFIQLNDHYHYFLLGMKAMGDELIKNNELNTESPAFEELWHSLADCGINGGLCLEDGYAAARWKTAEVISNVGSTADILYQPKMVFYDDNTSEAIEAISLPYPRFGNLTPHTTYRGGGLFALKNEDQRKNDAAYIFARWITQKEVNVDFVTKTGYLPVKDEALSHITSGEYSTGDAGYDALYKTVSEMKNTHSFVAIPLFDNASVLQQDFEKNIKFVLSSARNQCEAMILDGTPKKEATELLISWSLTEFKALCAS